jgi:peptidylprolyl isomerase
MPKPVKFLTITFSSGLLIGGVIIGWLYTHKGETAADVVRPTSVAGNVLGATSSDSGNSSSQPGSPLMVSNSGNQGSVPGESSQQSTSASSAPSSTSSSDSESSAPSLPSPSNFSVYDQYKGNATALYQDVIPGTGAAIQKGSVVTVQYKGYLTDGTEFDESYARGKAFTFTEGAGTVIPGWEEGLYGMKAGGQRRLIVPPSQGYGAVAHGPIPANSVLVFDVVLVSVQ